MIGQVMAMLKGKSSGEDYAYFESLGDVRRVSERKAIQRIKKMSSDGWGGQNALLLGENGVVYMMPHNNGMPTCPFVWYNKNGKYQEIINNQEDFTQVQNLSEVLDKTADVMRESYERKQPVVPFSNFGIRLTDEIQLEYSGNGELVLITGNFLNPNAKAEPEGASAYFANDFLDKFIGWNFGDVVKDKKELEAKLLDFNQRLIKDGTRAQEHPTGFEVCYRGQTDCFYRFARE